jgi:broad specificity phosphatase PhoE
VSLLARSWRVAPPARDHACALAGELPHHLEPDPAGRARDEAALAVEPEIHAPRLSRVSTTIVLVRHGETDWNRERRFQGHADPPLNDAGRAQALDCADELRAETFAAVYTSPLLRARETAAILAHELGLEPLADESLQEVDVGSWSGLTREEVETRFPDGYTRWLDYGHGWDDGESYDDLGRRVTAGLLGIAGRHPNATVLGVTHGGPIRSALAVADGVPFEDARRSIHVIGNCAIVRIAARDGKLERVH